MGSKYVSMTYLLHSFDPKLQILLKFQPSSIILADFCVG